jgi:hypothetical protein
LDLDRLDLREIDVVSEGEWASFDLCTPLGRGSFRLRTMMLCIYFFCESIAMLHKSIAFRKMSSLSDFLASIVVWLFMICFFFIAKVMDALGTPRLLNKYELMNTRMQVGKYLVLANSVQELLKTTSVRIQNDIQQRKNFKNTLETKLRAYVKNIKKKQPRISRKELVAILSRDYFQELQEIGATIDGIKVFEDHRKLLHSYMNEIFRTVTSNENALATQQLAHDLKTMLNGLGNIKLNTTVLTDDIENNLNEASSKLLDMSEKAQETLLNTRDALNGNQMEEIKINDSVLNSILMDVEVEVEEPIRSSMSKPMASSDL